MHNNADTIRPLCETRGKLFSGSECVTNSLSQGEVIDVDLHDAQVGHRGREMGVYHG